MSGEEACSRLLGTAQKRGSLSRGRPWALPTPCGSSRSHWAVPVPSRWRHAKSGHHGNGAEAKLAIPTRVQENEVVVEIEGPVVALLSSGGFYPGLREARAERVTMDWKDNQGPSIG
jgi:hypothetical protein